MVRDELHRVSMRTHTTILGKFKEQFKTGAHGTVHGTGKQNAST